MLLVQVDCKNNGRLWANTELHFPLQKFQSQERCRYPLTNSWCFRSPKILDLSPHFHCHYQQSTCPGRWWGPYPIHTYGLDGEEVDRPGPIDLKNLSWIIRCMHWHGKGILGNTWRKGFTDWPTWDVEVWTRKPSWPGYTWVAFKSLPPASHQRDSRM